MRFLLSAALIAAAFVPVACPTTAFAADLAYDYRAPPPRLYERPALLPPPIEYERPIVRRLPPPSFYGEGYRPYGRPYEYGYGDFAYRRPQRPQFGYAPY